MSGPIPASKDSLNPIYRDEATLYSLIHNPTSIITNVIDPDTCAANIRQSFFEYETRAEELAESIYSEKLPVSRSSAELISSIIQLEKESNEPLDRALAYRDLPHYDLAEFRREDSPIPSKRAMLCLSPSPTRSGQIKSDVPFKEIDDEVKTITTLSCTKDLSKEMTLYTANKDFTCPSISRASHSIQCDIDHADIEVKINSQIPDNPGMDNIAPKEIVLANTPSALQYSGTGSLSNFMKVRGQSKRQKVCREHDTQLLLPSKATSAKPGQTHTTNQSNEGFLIQDCPPPYPESTQSAQYILFISAGLLQTQRGLLRTLESMPNAPTLVFRDFSPIIHSSDPSIFVANDERALYCDADITLSPTAGVIFATAQDFTQLYLPGRVVHNISGIDDMNSPFRERIYHTCRKYPKLYLLCVHTSEPSGQPIQIDRRLSDALKSACNYCASLKEYADVKVVHTTSEPKALTRWILNLAEAHSILRSDREPNSFNGSPDLPRAPLFRPCESETLAERYLKRNAEVNCFTACLLLHLLSTTIPHLAGVDQSVSTPIETPEQLHIGLYSLLSGKWKDWLLAAIGAQAFERTINIFTHKMPN